jgi:hypothetical protein
MYQFDLLASDINASKYLVAVWDSFYSPQMPLATTYYMSQLAPDGKIYINCGNGTLEMHVINYPDSAGSACEFCQHCIHLPAFNGFTIPNHPNYFLGAETGTVCDSLTNDISDLFNSNFEYYLFPNPVREKVYITSNKKNLIKSVRFFNSIGQEQNVKFIQNSFTDYMEINTSLLSPGVYFVELTTDGINVVKKVIKE